MALSWKAAEQELDEWLGLGRSWGSGLVEVRLARGRGHLVCHSTRSGVVAEAAGNPALAGALDLAPDRIEELVRLGWLPPGDDATGWLRRWEAEEPLHGVAAAVLAVPHLVYRADPGNLHIKARPCGDASCVIHAVSDRHRRRTGALLPLG